MTSAWIWDDPEIHSDQLFMRNVPRKPAFVIPNLVTRRLEVKAAALRFDADGMSVISSDVLASEGHSRGAVCNWDTHTSVEFAAGTARSTSEAGVIYNPVDDHPAGEAIGKAHSLVRTRETEPDRTIRRNIQTAIAAQCRWLDEDPHKPNETATAAESDSDEAHGADDIEPNGEGQVT
ncbi:hypothetical protein EUA06_15140 [Nocardioides glacieisoli]|uniref:Uncharacterized protein n=1 Tax=Nocardioides glacieisoli TaxID=1168730 RepID=A0A4Q2RQ35_9ACTN|nr:hypothetical protein [Nocardioides glacieisoli]RYB89323.1 hypothetical protein EUA06_15140 [Nocardioides glacieisoli]